MTWLIGASAMVMCAWWAVLPLEQHPGGTAVTMNQPSPGLIENSPNASDTIDLVAFAARLWNPPLPQETDQQRQSKSAQRQELIRLQLIGIINDGGALKAALYDPDTDRLLIVRSGDRIRRHTVTAISAEGVELSDGRSTTRLTLIEDRS
ncbi:MAG: hypothetical protein IH983_00320 [Planctomycetes bacterium]|nr:hypothetical protein [Planctomycetota bacterium]